MELEAFSNPIAPANFDANSSKAEDKDTHPLTNEDFRKLLMTPRVGGSGSGPLASVRSGVHASTRGERKLTKKEENENKKKKKKFYAAMKKQEEDTLAELAKKYRDRAKERRDGANPDYQSEDPLTSMAAYRAVAPDSQATADAAERRKQMIEESKFLGGDMKHTHLVKGLDYALLHKVKAELVESKEDDDDEDEIEDKEGDEEENELQARNKKLSGNDAKDNEWAPKSTMAANIISLLNREKLPTRNDLFLPGRMAYIVDLEDEYADEIPTTIIRSKADCPNADSLSQLSTNDIVINKLIQIIAYLRQGGTSRKKKKEKSNYEVEPVNKPKPPEKKKPDFDDSIYGDIGDYVPSIEKKDRQKQKEDRDRYRESRHSYFDKSDSHEELSSSKEKKDPKPSLSASFNAATSVLDSNPRSRYTTKLDQEAPESYAECYPGAPENDDAMVDSDDEVDFTKMDIGSKKSTVGRWDFDTQEEYGEYMSKKEALPKAAFQYGVKMADGRKTRRIPPKKDEKAKLDRDLQKINAILSKRKGDSGEAGTSSATPHVDRDHKRIKNV